MEMRPATEADLPAIADLIGWSFCLPEADVVAWSKRAGIENARILFAGGRAEACLFLMPMGQFFGGKSVPTCGVAGVATLAEARGSGGAVTLMTQTLRELRARGVALSTLYPATIGLYRRVGYEIAGARYEVKVDPNALGISPGSLPLRTMTPADEDAVRIAYTTHASRTDGHMDRGTYIWNRVKAPRGADSVRAFVTGEGRVEGYAFFYLKKLFPSYHYEVLASDLVALTPAAHRRLLGLVTAHGTLGDSFAWNGAPNDPFVQLLPRVGTKIQVMQRWMLRLVDLPAALAKRGWRGSPGAAKVEVELEVSDRELQENAGRWTLKLEGGRAEVTRGGAGAIKLDVRSLASLYSGFTTPSALAAMGELDASESDVERLSVVFPGGSPWMPDMF
ncbi:MAG TPA: GNAT family N-acetyltransferase [Polyangiaceae bacterium]